MDLLRMVPRGYMGADDRPTRAMFSPSDTDEQHVPVRVSVWDYAVVNAGRAEQLNPSPPNKPRTGFTLADEKIPPLSERAVAGGLPAITVVRDADGAAGNGIAEDETMAHYGIEGLSRAAPTTPAQKVLRKDLLLELADASTGPVP